MQAFFTRERKIINAVRVFERGRKEAGEREKTKQTYFPFSSPLSECHPLPPMAAFNSLQPSRAFSSKMLWELFWVDLGTTIPQSLHVWSRKPAWLTESALVFSPQYKVNSRHYYRWVLRFSPISRTRTQAAGMCRGKISIFTITVQFLAHWLAHFYHQ